MDGNILLFFLALFIGFGNISCEAPKSNSSETRRVIVDVDVGLDDYYALLVLFYAEKLGMIKIEAIVCTTGNSGIKNVVKNTVRLVELLNKTDVPIYKGVKDPILLYTPLYRYFGKNGMGDLTDLRDPSLNIVQKNLTATALNQLVSNDPGQISILSLAPLTDMALTGKLYREFFKNIKDIYILGGNYKKVNQSGAGVEFNFLSDIVAAHIVFENVRKKIYLLPLEKFTKPTITYNWRYDVLGSKTPSMNLATRAEKSLRHDLTSPHWNPSDAFLAFCFIQPKFCDLDPKLRGVDVELSNSEKMGWIRFNDKKKNKNVQVINNIDQEAFEEYMLEVGTYLI